MGMANEIEVKFAVEDFGGVRRALRKAGGEYLGTALQTDTYFDTAGRDLLDRDCGMRIRVVRSLRAGARPLDTRPELTYKGPGGGSELAKIRKEVETHFDNEEAMTHILHAFGLEVTVSLQKRRASYRLGPCVVELDELPLIGRYVEIEGPGEKHIHAVARQLALQGEPITDHYVSMISRACRKAGVDCKHIRFTD